jgi:hypothetical protein
LEEIFFGNDLSFYCERDFDLLCQNVSLNYYYEVDFILKGWTKNWGNKLENYFVIFYFSILPYLIQILFHLKKSQKITLKYFLNNPTSN